MTARVLSTAACLVLVGAGLAQASPEAGAPRHVVIVSVDGLRPDAITKAVMPRHTQLTREGTSARHATTITKSLTLPSHASMISGVDVDAHGLSWNSFLPHRGSIKVPTIFTRARDQKLSTAIFVGKQKLRHLAKVGSVDHFEIPSDPSCAGVAAAASAYFAEHQPRLSLVHFADTDDAGHAHGWSSAPYTEALRAVDHCLGTLVDAIDKTTAAGSTVIIVTADHGGEGTSHASGSESCRRIPWIARGPGFARGGTIEAATTTFDTAATALAALGLPPLPKMRGASRLSAPSAAKR